MDALASSGYASLPLREFAPLKQQDIAPTFFQIYAHPLERNFESMRPMHILGYHHKVTAPALNIGGWYDIFLQDTITNFKLLREEASTPAARQSKLIIGPWTHGGVNNPMGEINFGFASNAVLFAFTSDFSSWQVTSF